MSVSNFMGYLKGKSTLKCPSRNFIYSFKPFTFIQATGFEDGKCHVEAQYKEGEILRMYGFDDMTETGLFDILRDFLLEKVPDISGWNHIGDY